jgi:hypothetical protein
VDTSKSHKVKNRQVQSVGNPFIKLIEDKVKISKAVQEGKPLSTLTGINFVKPI